MTDPKPQSAADYEVNGHTFEVTEEYGDAKQIQCTECLCLELLKDDQDPDEHLGLMTPECHIEWLREPDGGFHGVALRNASGFQGRELIGVREGGKLGEGEVADNVRIYDDDAPLLASMLDQSEWQRRER